MSWTRNEGSPWKWFAVTAGAIVTFYVGAYFLTVTPYRSPYIVVPWYSVPGVTGRPANRVDEWLDRIFAPLNWIDQHVRIDVWTPDEPQLTPPGGFTPAY